jgi:hypothetical protein
MQVEIASSSSDSNMVIVKIIYVRGNELLCIE